MLMPPFSPSPISRQLLRMPPDSFRAISPHYAADIDTIIDADAFDCCRY